MSAKYIFFIVLNFILFENILISVSKKARKKIQVLDEIKFENNNLDKNTISKKTEIIIPAPAIRIDATDKAALNSHDLKKDTEDLIINNDNLSLLVKLTRPIEFTESGLADYFKNIYNNDLYLEILPFDCSHILEFLNFGKINEQNLNEQFLEYASAVLHLFSKKFKACDFIHPKCCYKFLEELESIVFYYQNKSTNFYLKNFGIDLKLKMTSAFSNYFELFQSNPDEFLSSLSNQIALESSKNNKSLAFNIQLAKFQKDFVAFINLIISKLLYDSESKFEAYDLFRQIAELLYKLFKAGIIKEREDLDEIYWTLLLNFIAFLKLSKEKINNDFLFYCLNDIEKNSLNLDIFDYAEQEILMTNKKDYFSKECKKLLK